MFMDNFFCCTRNELELLDEVGVERISKDEEDELEEGQGTKFEVVFKRYNWAIFRLPLL